MSGLLRSPQLLAYLTGNLVSIAGTWGQRVVVFWTAWELTGSMTVLGVLAALDLLPSVVMAPVAGSLADSRPAFVLTRNVQAISAVPPLIMVGVLQFGEVTLPVLMLLTLAGGILNGLDHPLRLLLIGSIVPRKLVSGAIASNSIMFNIGRMAGPAIGGWTVSAGSPIAIFAVNAVSFLLFAGVISCLKPAATKTGHGNTGSLNGEIIGWKGVISSFEKPLLLAFALFAAIAALIRPIFELLPSFADGIAQDQDRAAVVFSLLTSSQGLGAMIGAFSAAHLLARMKYQSFVILTGLVSTLAAFVFVGTRQFHIALVAIAVLSGAVLANGIATQIALQTRLPERARGRALSLYTMTFRGLPAMGALFVGAIGEVVPLGLVFTGLAILMTILIVWVFTETRRVEASE